MDIKTFLEDGASSEQVERMLGIERYGWMLLSYDMAVVMDLEGGITEVNTAWSRASGHPQEALLGNYLVEFMHVEERERTLASFQHLITSNTAMTTIAFRFLCADGEYKRFNWNVLYSPEFEVFFCIVKDLSDVNNIRHVAYHDTLTGLPNRLYLSEILPDLILSATQQGQSLAYVLLDVFEFKKVNDTLGHHAGDIMLQVMAERLRSCVTHPENCARIGSAKFALIESACDSQCAARFAQRVVDIVNQPEEIGGQDVRVGALIGIVLAPADADTPANVMERAESALEEARRKGNNSVVFACDLEQM